LKRNPNNPKYHSSNASVYGVGVKLPNYLMGDVLKFFGEIINDLPDKKEKWLWFYNCVYLFKWS